MRLVRPLIPILLLLAGPLAGCGSSDSTETTDASPIPAPPGASAQSCPLNTAGIEALRVTGVGCRAGQKIATAWSRDATCAPAAGHSRYGCEVQGYRCVTTTTDRGISVSCARPGRSISFIAKPA
jgi:hypothetical protein